MMFSKHALFAFVLSVLAWAGTIAIAQDAIPVVVNVEANKEEGPLRPIWRFFGADEPNYAYMKDGKKLLADIGSLGNKTAQADNASRQSNMSPLPGNAIYFRTHNLLTTGPGAPALKWGSTNAYTEDPESQPLYDWRLLDLIFDTYLKNGVKPYVQIGFMPKALSTRPEPYEHTWRPGLPYDQIYTGWAYPPKDYDRWRELVYQWTRHCVERYGQPEVESWYWETWNEPNIGYWKGTREEFFKTHDYAIDGVLKALPTARVGGPDTAGDGGNFAREFYRHCLQGQNLATGQVGTKLDFVSFHAKGAPNWAGDHIQMGIAAQLKTIDAGFRLIAEFPELKNKPIIIGESDPEGCAACQGNRFAYRNGTMYSSYTAASFARKHELAQRHQVNFEGALTWAFTFEDQPYFAGFRQLASNGLPLAVFNVFRMYSHMDGQRLHATSDRMLSLDEVLNSGIRGKADVGVLACRKTNKVCVMLWHYHDDDVLGPTAQIDLNITGMPAEAKAVTMRRYLVDAKHSNAYAAWQKMGSPIAPDLKQYTQLQQASMLAQVAEQELSVTSEQLSLDVELARQGVTLIEITW